MSTPSTPDLPEVPPHLEPPTEAQERALIERLAKLRTGLTMWVPFFGHLLLKLDPIVAKPQHNVSTAAVSRDRKLFLNYHFCNSMTDSHLLFVLCHEVMHLAFAYFERAENRKAIVFHPTMGPVSLWNVAHDFSCNMIVNDMAKGRSQVTMPEGALHDEKYRNFSAEEIYDLLLDQAEKNGQMQSQGQGGEGQKGQKGQKGQGNPLDGINENTWGIDDCREDLGGGQNSDGSDATEGTRNQSAASKAELDQFWKIAIVEAAQVNENSPNRGNLPASLQKLIDEILNPKIAWRDILSRWVGENGRRADFTWRRPSRRSDSIGEMLPSLQRHGVDDIVVLWDTSGSMGGREAEIMSEVIGICEDMNLTLRVLCCDTRVASDNYDVTDPQDVQWAGGGGSCFLPAFQLLDEEGYQGVLIAFTDGYITVPETKPPNIREVLWVLWEGKDVDPTGGRWGEAIVVDNEGNVR